jgi:hypothetical protein
MDVTLLRMRAEKAWEDYHRQRGQLRLDVPLDRLQKFARDVAIDLYIKGYQDGFGAAGDGGQGDKGRE